MQLVSPGVGWVLTTDRLAWTDDNGANWRTITPPGVAARRMRGETLESNLEGTFFLDGLHGWSSTVEDPSSGDGPANVTVYRTIDGGKTWAVNAFHGPSVSTSGLPLFGGGLQFVDEVHGWYSGVYVTGMLRSPRLYRTSDGGVTWEEIPHPREAYQYDLRFTDSRDGWFAAEAPEPLFVTHDGGTSWESRSLPIPPGCTLASAGEGAAAPVFEGAEHGTVYVRGGCPDESSGSLTWFFSTADGGASWTLVSTVDRVIRASIVSSSTWFYAADMRLSDQLYSMTDGGARWQAIRPDWARVYEERHNPRPVGAAVYSLDFVTLTDGWGLVFANSGVPDLRLIATTDGGHTWTALKP